MQGGYLPFNVDVAVFKASEEWAYLEVYLSIPRSNLNDIKEGQLFKSMNNS